jgi:hypothetical protein
MELNEKIRGLYFEYLNTPLERDVLMERLSALVGNRAIAERLVPFLEAAYGTEAPGRLPPVEET